jgi:hypothetical protein
VIPISRVVSVGHVEDDFAPSDNGLLILGNLIAGRQIRVEIILPVKDALEPDLGVEAEAGLDGLFDTEAVDGRQHAWESGIDGRDLRVRRAAEHGRPTGSRAPTARCVLRSRPAAHDKARQVAKLCGCFKHIGNPQYRLLVERAADDL